MPRSIADIFSDNPTVEIAEFVGYEDGGVFGLSSDGRSIKIFDAGFAKQLSELPGANSDSGHITIEGYCVHGKFNIDNDAYISVVKRQ